MGWSSVYILSHHIRLKGASTKLQGPALTLLLLQEVGDLGRGSVAVARGISQTASGSCLDPRKQARAG